MNIVVTVIAIHDVIAIILKKLFKKFLINGKKFLIYLDILRKHCEIKKGECNKKKKHTVMPLPYNLYRHILIKINK